MERFATIFITSLCAAPLFFLVAAWSMWGKSKGGGDQALANAYGGLFLGIGAAVVGFVLVSILTHFLLIKGYVRYVQLADLLLIIGWGIAWYIYADKQPYELTYDAHNAILDVEIRARRDLLQNKSIDEVAGIRFVGASLTYYQPEHIRQEGDYFILPWYTYLHRVKDWDVLVDLPNQETYFKMDLPKRPKETTSWSNWVAPSPHPGCTTPAGLMIRYRFRLVPYGQDP